MLVSWEGGSPRKQAWEAPVDCLESRQLGGGIGKLVSCAKVTVHTGVC